MKPLRAFTGNLAALVVSAHTSAASQAPNAPTPPVASGTTLEAMLQTKDGRKDVGATFVEWYRGPAAADDYRKLGGAAKRMFLDRLVRERFEREVKALLDDGSAPTRDDALRAMIGTYVSPDTRNHAIKQYRDLGPARREAFALQAVQDVWVPMPSKRR